MYTCNGNNMYEVGRYVEGNRGCTLGFLICGFESIRLRAYGMMMGTLKEVGECVEIRQPPRGRAPIPISLKRVKKS